MADIGALRIYHSFSRAFIYASPPIHIMFFAGEIYLYVYFIVITLSLLYIVTPSHTVIIMLLITASAFLLLQLSSRLQFKFIGSTYYIAWPRASVATISSLFNNGNIIAVTADNYEK